MTKQNTVLLLICSILLLPGLAAAVSEAPAPAISLLPSFLTCPAADPDTVTQAVTPAVLESAIALSNSPHCCRHFEGVCERRCEPGIIANFTCNPESCTALCFCGS